MKRTELQRKTPLRSHTNLKRNQVQCKKSSKKVQKERQKVIYEVELYFENRLPKKEYTKALRDFVKERDGHVCQLCGSPGEQIHHVITRGRYYKPWYTLQSVHDPRNLMLVCNACHQRIHDVPGAIESVIRIQEKRFGKLRREFV